MRQRNDYWYPCSRAELIVLVTIIVCLLMGIGAKAALAKTAINPLEVWGETHTPAEVQRYEGDGWTLGWYELSQAEGYSFYVSFGEQDIWPTWGNMTIGDCTFAAAADWELDILHHTANEAEIIEQFHEAGGSDTEGLDVGKWSHYWLTHGIGGIKAKAIEIPTLGVEQGSLRQTEEQVKGLVAGHGAVLVGMDPGHEELVAGTGVYGVRIITWGEERIVPWVWFYENLIEVTVVTTDIQPAPKVVHHKHRKGRHGHHHHRTK